MMSGNTLWRRAGVLTLATGLVMATLTAGVSRTRSREAAPPPATDRPVSGVATDERGALAAARRSGTRVEVEAGRGERTTLYANPDGTLTRQHHSRPIRAYRGGRWLPIDPTLVRYGNGRVGPKATSTVMSFSGGGMDPLATLGHVGQQVSLSWLGRLPEPELDGSTATYREVLSDVDLVVHATDSGFSHVLVIKTPQAARDPRLRSVQFGLRTDGVRLRADGDRLVATDGNGTPLFEAPRPKMWEAGEGDGDPTRTPPESARRAGVGLRLAGDRMILTPDAAMLTGSGVRFPLYLDPFMRSTSRIDWAMVDSGYPNEEYWHFDGKLDERIGLCPPDPNCNSSKIKRQFYTFDTSYYTSAAMEIVSADFAIPLKQVSYPGETHNADLFLMTSGSISDATNWNNQPNTANWSGAEYLSSNASTAALGSCTSTTAPNLAFPAKVAVEKRWSGILLGLRSAEEGNNHAARRFCSNAVLSVTFNRVPSAPTNLAADLAGACRTGAPYQYADRPPRLSAYLSDDDTEDAEPLSAEWVVTWPGGSKTWHDTPGGANRTTFYYQLNDTAIGVPNLPENAVITYKVRAHDGRSWGPYSASCEFKIDRSSPAGPDIDSPQYLPLDAGGPGEPSPSCVPDSAKRDGVGLPGTFTFKSSHTDVVSYEYTISSPVGTSVPWTTVAVAAGAPATVTWMPESEGPHVITARAIDQAGRTNGVDSTCTFVVKQGRPAIATWALADPPGSTQAADGAENQNPAVSGGDVAFGAIGPDGVAGRAATFTGSSRSHLAPARLGLVDTSRYFSVGAWANVEPGTEAATQTIVSQNGSGDYGFALGYDGSTRKWYFSIPTSDGIAYGAATLQGSAATPGVWSHLVAVFDPVKRQMTLQVDGEAVYSRTIRTAWHAQRALHIGRKFTRTGYTQYFRGQLAEVAVFDRIVPRSEGVRLAAVRKAYWNLNTQVTPIPSPGFDVSPEYSDDTGGGAFARAMGLHSGAAIYRYDPTQFPPPEGPPALMGTGHLVLDTPAEYTASSVGARTDRSFTVAARVRLSSLCDTARPRMTVLSQPGAAASAFLLRCVLVGTTPRWQAGLTTADTAGAAGPTVVDNLRAPTTGAPGQHLTLVFDATLRELRLYVEGQLSGTTRLADTHVPWHAAVDGLQIGRAKVDGAWTDHLAGDVDDIRVYAGVLSDTEIAQIADLTELPGT
jgi:hypothetical protein